MQRFPHQAAAISGLNEIVAVGRRQVEPLKEQVRNINLYGMRVALAVEIGDVQLLRVGVVVDKGLRKEVRVIIVGI